jgi:hypothetical protein
VKNFNVFEIFSVQEAGLVPGNQNSLGREGVRQLIQEIVNLNTKGGAYNTGDDYIRLVNINHAHHISHGNTLTQVNGFVSIFSNQVMKE